MLVQGKSKDLTHLALTKQYRITLQRSPRTMHTEITKNMHTAIKITKTILPFIFSCVPIISHYKSRFMAKTCTASPATDSLDNRLDTKRNTTIAQQWIQKQKNKDKIKKKRLFFY